MLRDESKQNCWEFKGCGREPGGENIADCGICPASIEEKLDGIHGGEEFRAGLLGCSGHNV